MTLGDILDGYKLYSYQRACAEGKVGQWFVRQFLMTVVKLTFWVVWSVAIVYPWKLAWNWNKSRTQDKGMCIMKTVLCVLVFYAILFSAIQVLCGKAG